MIGLGAVLVVPALSVFPYRRAGLGWPRAAALGLLAVVLSFVGLVAALFYQYAIDIDAALCGSRPVAAGVATVGAYLVVATWAGSLPRRVWGWLFAPAAAAAVLTLVSYFFAGAHDYCET